LVVFHFKNDFSTKTIHVFLNVLIQNFNGTISLFAEPYKINMISVRNWLTKLLNSSNKMAQAFFV
jgi:hypothetical protein